MKAILAGMIAVALSSTSAAASAASDLAAIDANYQTCVEKNPDNAGMKECTNKAYFEADKVLNKTYLSIAEALRVKVPGDSELDDQKEELKRLLASERAWILYRDAECQLQGVAMLGGSGEGLVIGGCLYSLTQKRARDLEDLFADRFHTEPLARP
ncbi:MAG TPA: lysozyme inhibitor LprI family protein [Methylocella sp.]|nr:lysozyme inhibitor LprI family protein [Methylocella sp.]